MRPEHYRPRSRPPGPETSTAWTVFIEALQVSASIGVHPHEHETRQMIIVDVELDMTGAPTPKHDRLNETADYGAITKAITGMADEGHVQLVETLAERIARWCLKDLRVTKAKVRVAKPAALPNAKAVGCVITVGRSA
jgi:dihydroneopterin aldolase